VTTYLDDFYHQMERWSFNLDLFLEQSFRPGDANSESGRKLYKTEPFMKMPIFCPNLYSMGLMTNRDFQNYSSLFELMESTVKAPDLLIYLRSILI
jgi:deoxyadenosine/deoxycytidine kinase